MHIVTPSSGVRIVNVEDQLFCCGPSYFNSSSGTCINSTHGSNAPFAVDPGSVIVDRLSDSTLPDQTGAVTSTVTIPGATIKSLNASAATTIGTSPSLPQTSDRGEGTVGVSAGIPLGMALLGAVGLLWRQKRDANRLRKERNDWEEKYVALLESQMETLRSENVPRSSSKRVIHQLEGIPIGEMAT